jgi:hypothetical protein
VWHVSSNVTLRMVKRAKVSVLNVVVTNWNLKKVVSRAVLVEIQNVDNMAKTYDDWDEYDDYLQEKAERDYEIAMALQPQRELEEQLMMDELFPE